MLFQLKSHVPCAIWKLLLHRVTQRFRNDFAPYSDAISSPFRLDLLTREITFASLWIVSLIGLHDAMGHSTCAKGCGPHILSAKQSKRRNPFMFFKYPAASFNLYRNNQPLSVPARQSKQKKVRQRATNRKPWFPWLGYTDLLNYFAKQIYWCG